MRFSCESANDRSAHDGIACVCRAREATAQRSRPTGRFVLVARIRRCLGLPLPAGLYPVAADKRHGENDNPNKHACLLGGVSPLFSKAEADRHSLLACLQVIDSKHINPRHKGSLGAG